MRALRDGGLVEMEMTLMAALGKARPMIGCAHAAKQEDITERKRNRTFVRAKCCVEMETCA
jgi:hypothetical protein